MICPIDGMTEIQKGENPCHQCGSDLSFYWKILELPVAFYNEAQTFIKAGLLEDAIKKLQVAQELDPRFKESYVSLGDIYAHQGCTDKAINQWKKALIFFPDDPDIQQRIDNLQTSQLTNNSVSVTHRIIQEGCKTGTELFGVGFLLFVISALYCISGYLYIQRDQTCLLLSILGAGAILMLIGLNLLMPNYENIQNLSFSGFILSVSSIILFVLLYADNWNSPVSDVILLTLIIGFFLLVLSIFFGLVQKPMDHPVKG
jgi:tetratricopeptide (TPR) repeat protein